METKTQKPALLPSDILVTASGGILDLVSADGELLAQVPVAPGQHRASSFLHLVGPGQSLEISEGISVFTARSRRSVTVYPDAVNRASDANPDWRPTTATANEQRLRALLFRKREESTRTQRRAAGQASLEAARERAVQEAAQRAADEKAAQDAAEAAKQAEREALASAIAKASAVVE